MNSRLGTCFLLLVVGQLCSSASISMPTELPLSSYSDVVDHFRKVFLGFPCSNKVVVNQLFDIYSKFGDLDREENVIVNAVFEMKRLLVVGSGMNVAPDVWKSAVQAYESRDEVNLDNLVAELKLTPTQVDRLHIIYSTDRPYGEKHLYQDNFAVGIALGISEGDIKRVLDGHLRSIIDFDSRVVISKKAAEELGALAEEKCERKYLNPGHHTRKTNIVRDFLQAIDAIKVNDSEK